MLTSFFVSIILLIIWGGYYYKNKYFFVSSKLYFGLLAIMGVAGILFDPLPLMGLYPTEYSLINILLFAILMLLVIKPWIKFDKFLINSPVFIVKENAIGTLKKIYVVVIILSLYAIVYALPYTLTAWTKGADVVRSASEDTLLPRTIFTTMAVGFATFSPVSIVLFYISLLDNRLSRYRVFLLVSSLAYVIVSMAQAARDGFIYTSLTYIVFYIIFKPSLSEESKKIIRKMSVILIIALGMPLIVFSYSRFGHSLDDRYDDMLFGTWGYIYQQPYVFDHVLDQFDSFYGFNRRLKFLNSFIPIEGCKYAAETKIEFMFGTQFSSYYMISGYSSLFIGMILYIFIFKSIINRHLKKKKIFPLLVAFVIYVYFTLSGLFYFRFGGNDSEFLFYMSILFGSYFIPDYIKVSYDNKDML